MRRRKCGSGVKEWNVAAMHTFDFTFPDAWSRKKIKAPPSRMPGVSVEVWNDVYTPADDWSRLKWPGEMKVMLLEVAKEYRGGMYMTIDELAPYGDDSVEFLVNDELFYHAGDLTVPARPELGTICGKALRDLGREQTRTMTNRLIRTTITWRKRERIRMDWT